MLITELELQNFRNYEKQKIEFNNNINIFYGDVISPVIFDNLRFHVFTRHIGTGIHMVLTGDPEE